MVSSDFISKTSLANEKLLPPTHDRIKGVTGNFLNVLGVLLIVLEIKVAKFHHTVHIVKDLHHAFLLGLDFLRDNSAHIDFDTNTLHAKCCANVDVVCALDTNAGLPRNDNEIVLKSRSETTVPVQISRCRDGQVVLLDPLPSLTLSQQVIAAKCLVQVTKRKAYLKVLNPSSRAKCPIRSLSSTPWRI